MVSQLSRNSSGLAYSNTVHRVCNICSDIVWSPRLAMQLCRDNFFWYPVWKLKQETKCNYRWCSYQNSIWTNALMQMLQRFHCSSSEKKIHIWIFGVNRLWRMCLYRTLALALFHSQSSLYAFMLYELLLFYLSACIASVLVFISLRTAFTEGRIACNLYSGTSATALRLSAGSQRCCKI